jgi:hypothetical protein
MPTNQTPEALAEECKRAIGLAFQAARYESLTGALEKLKDAQALLFRLRDMAASGAKFNAWPEEDYNDLLSIAGDIVDAGHLSTQDLGRLRTHLDAKQARPKVDDAARYRWLRQHNVDSYLACGRGAALDAAIDDAIAATKRGEA